MRTNILGICTILLALATTQAAFAQNSNSIEGVWNVTVTVTNCQTGAPIRVVHAIQGFSHDGSFSETANTSLRGSSIGTWNHDGGDNYSATYWFYRYTSTGAFASFAYAINKEKLDDDGNHFTASGTIQDFDANGNLISIGCVVHSATRLATSGQGN
ncbi:MAG TPA: hypothetical protein VF447_09905 [Terriglobales bacterium]